MKRYILKTDMAKGPLDNQPFECIPMSGIPNCAWKWVASVFGLRSSPYSNYLCRTTDIAAVENIYNIFIFKICRAKIRTRKREYALRITAQSRVLKTDACREATLKKVHYTTIQYVNETLYYCHSIAIKSEREGTMGCLLP